MRLDQVKTAHEGKRVGLASKLNQGKAVFGQRNYSLALPNEKRAHSNMRGGQKLPALKVNATDLQGRRISMDPESMLKTYNTLNSKTIDTAIDLDALKDIALDDGVISKLNKTR